MPLVSNDILRRLRDNRRVDDPVPVVRLYNPYGKQWYLLVAQDADNPEKYLCVCDIGYGADYGYVTMRQLEDLDNRGVPLVYDEGETSDAPWGDYLQAARRRESAES